MTVTVVEPLAAGHVKPPVALLMLMAVPVALKLYDVPSTKQLLGNTDACAPAVQAMEVAVVPSTRQLLGFVARVQGGAPTYMSPIDADKISSVQAT